MINPEQIGPLVESSLFFAPLAFGAVLLKLKSSHRVSIFHTEKSGVDNTQSKLYKDPENNSYILVPDGASASFSIDDGNQNRLCVVEHVGGAGQNERADVFIGYQQTVFDKSMINTPMAINGLSTAKAIYMDVGKDATVLESFIASKNLKDVTPPPVVRMKRGTRLKKPNLP